MLDRGGCRIGMWKFVDYVAEDKSVPIEDWRRTLLPAEQAEFDLAIECLQKSQDWDSNKRLHRKYRELTRELAGLTELKFDTTIQERGRNYKKRFRAVGLMNREKRTFILLGGFQKGSRNRPIPEDAF